MAVEFEGRYSAPGVNAVDMALMLILAMPIAMHLVLRNSQRKQNFLFKFLNLAYIPLAIFALRLPGVALPCLRSSRSAFIWPCRPRSGFNGKFSLAPVC